MLALPDGGLGRVNKGKLGCGFFNFDAGFFRQPVKIRILTHPFIRQIEVCTALRIS